MATLPGAWHCRVSTGTVWPGVSILSLGEVESWICNFYLSVAARKIVQADPSLRHTSMLLGRKATNQLQYGELVVLLHHQAVTSPFPPVYRHFPQGSQCLWCNPRNMHMFWYKLYRIYNRGCDIRLVIKVI